MLRFSFLGVRVGISLWFSSFICLLMVLGDEARVLDCLAAMLAHEGGHLAALFAFGSRPTGINLRFGRIELIEGQMPLRASKRAAVYGAGVATNLLLAGLTALAGRSVAAEVNVALAAFNALPAGNLDGGQLARILLGRFMPKPEGFMRCVTFVCGGLMLFFGIQSPAAGGAGLSLAAVALYLIFGAALNIF